jgi:hypothetical protein
MKITKQRLKEMIKEELQTESVPTPRAWMHLAAAKLKSSAPHVPDKKMGERLNMMAEEITAMIDWISRGAGRDRQE